MKRQRKKLSYRLRVFVLYLLATIIPILLFIGIVDTQYVGRLRAQMLDTLDENADALVELMDGGVNQVRDIANSLILLDGFSQSYWPEKPKEANLLMKRLNIYVMNSGLFDEIVLYSKKDDYLFSNTTSYTKERFLKLKRIPGLTVAQIDETLENSYTPLLLPTQGDDAFCILYPVHIRREVRGLFVFVAASRLNTLMRDSLDKNEGCCVLTAGDGTRLFAFSSDGTLPDASVLARCAAGERSIRAGASALYCASSASDATGLSASIVISDGSIHRSISSMRWKWGILIVASILLNFLASTLTSLISTRPIVDLSSRISKDIRKKEQGINEIEHIDASVRHLNDLATSAMKKMDQLGDYMMLRLLSGSIEDVDDANRVSQMLGTSIYADAYQVCVIRTPQAHKAGEIAQSIRELLPAEISSLTRKQGEVFVCVLFCGIDDQTGVDTFCERFLCRHPDSKLAFGSSVPRLEEIPVSFMEASLADRSEEGSVVSFTCPAALSAQIARCRSCVEAGDIDAITAYFDTLLTDVRRGQYTQTEQTCLLVHAYRLLAESALSADLSGAIPGACDVIAADTPQTLLSGLQSVRDRLQSIRGEHRQDRAEALVIDRMVSYLNDNYSDPNFSLQQMAHVFHMTPSMLSRFFKEAYGQNINDYLIDRKMLRARTLLQETDLPISKIGQELGYQGPNSFIRRFKATYGMTPGEFTDVR